MSQSIIGEGTKIAQAAKDLNVTSVTIRRYVAEFNVPTTSDDSGIMVLPPSSVAELSLIRKLKEDGLSNQEVLDRLSGNRPSGPEASADQFNSNNGSNHPGQITAAPRVQSSALHKSDGLDDPESEEGFTDQTGIDRTIGEGLDNTDGTSALSARPRHSLTCQTCGKSFEHTNPRLRDCLDCYRTKRKERRRGGTPRVVIQHPLAKLAANKTRESSTTETRDDDAQSEMSGEQNALSTGMVVSHQTRSVRNYRKAVDETRQITSNLKRRLDRADLPEGERKWLEQTYAYQLILHQGWRHLLEYRSATSHQPQSQAETSETSVAN